MLQGAFRACSQVHRLACSPGRSHLYSMAHTLPGWLYAPTPALKKLSSTLPSTLSSTLTIALDDILPACLTIYSQVSSQDAPKYTPRHALNATPNCTRCPAPSLLGSRLPSKLSWGKTLPISFDYMHSCMLPGARTRDLLRYRSQAQGDGWWVADGAWHMVAEIMTWVDIIVWIISLVRPP